MEVVVDGVDRGSAALVQIYHASQQWPGVPQVAAIYASGFVRLKPNADPSPPLPFGGSFILGPAYWAGGATYYHNPQLRRLEVDTTWLPSAPLRMLATAANHDFDIDYELALPPPTDQLTRLHVSQTYTATAQVAIDPARRAERQGFKLAQVSSMFINDAGACEGGNAACHDSNAARYIDADLVRHQEAFGNLTLPGFVFGAPQPLGSTWLDVLHTDDTGWQGNTPNLRIALDTLPADRTVTPQGWIGAATDPNGDNAGLWLHDDGAASQSWLPGQHAQIGYWLMAQDDPPEPWAGLGLRSGLTFLDFESSANCFAVVPGPPVTGSIEPIAGATGAALQLRYDVGSASHNWAQVRCNFDPPLDLSAYDHLRFDWRGDPAAANSLEVGLINPAAGQEQIFARGYHHPSHHPWWGQMVIPFKFLAPWTSGTTFDPSRVSALFVSVVKDPADDTGGAGRIAIDNLNAYNVHERSAPSQFEIVSRNPVAAAAAARWLARQQQSTGLLKSWAEESGCRAYTYDQALALIAFARERMWANADALVSALAATQDVDGSWLQLHDCATLAPAESERWEGDIAWAVYALSRYLALGGAHPQALSARNRGADWLTTRIDPADGCLLIDHTEATIDVWWALQAADRSQQADRLKHCLLTYYWDPDMGRFKGGRDWWQPYLDNQTWGAAFLRAIGQADQARRALSYARETLRLPAQGGQLFGLDGQAGVWSAWNEGSGQYIAVGGAGANDLLGELLAQQRRDGAMPGSPDDWSGGGVWTTRWHGVAPTAWLYYALTCGPLQSSAAAQCFSSYLPLVAAVCDRGPERAPSSDADNLEESAADWGGYCEGAPLWAITNTATPPGDGRSLECALLGGSPYSNIHCYRNLLPEPATNVFSLSLSFWFTPTTTWNNQGGPSAFNALEFSISAWNQAQRYEFALQWQNVGPGAPQWRYWDPGQPAQNRWVPIAAPAIRYLEAGRWHTLLLEGAIVAGQVQYRRFAVDDQSYAIDVTLPPASTPGEPDRLAVAVQLDSNAQAAPAHLFIDQVRFVRAQAAR